MTPEEEPKTGTEAPAPTPAPVAATEEPGKVLSRDALRAHFLDTKPESEIVNYRGAQVELRQPSVDETLSFQNAQGLEAKEMGIRILVNYAYVPGGEKVFDETDVAAILNMPFSADFQNLLMTTYKMMGVNVEEEDKSKAQG